jgi:hypothetical protein
VWLTGVKLSLFYVAVLFLKLRYTDTHWLLLKDSDVKNGGVMEYRIG